MLVAAVALQTKMQELAAMVAAATASLLQVRQAAAQEPRIQAAVVVGALLKALLSRAVQAVPVLLLFLIPVLKLELVVQ
jgi:hypothetical protein